MKPCHVGSFSWLRSLANQNHLIRSWTKDLFSGSNSLDSKDGILPSHLGIPQLCAEVILCFLKDKNKQVVNAPSHNDYSSSSLRNYCPYFSRMQSLISIYCLQTPPSLFSFAIHPCHISIWQYPRLDGLQSIRLEAFLDCLIVSFDIT